MCRTFLLAICMLATVSSQYVQLPYGVSGQSVGPDGPWWTLTLPVGSPEQNVSFHPIVGSQSSWWITSDACSKTSTPCIVSADKYYNNHTASAQIDRHLRNTTFGYTFVFGTASQVMNYTANGNWHEDSVRLNADLLASDVSQVVSGNTFVTYPGGTSYVPLSSLSLGIGYPNLISAVDGSFQGATLASEAQRQGAISSPSWSLHLGSVAYDQPGSIVLGGYDSTRVIGVPALYSDNNFVFRGITLRRLNSTNDMQIVTGQSIGVTADSSVPYLYLPSSVCTAMANSLPVTFDPALNLYLWNSGGTMSQDLVHGLSYFAFIFDQISIRIPLALLYLSLEAPLAASPTKYFPCYPSAEKFVLGRAFLQGAFLARSNGSVFLGQAPGPNVTGGTQLEIFQNNQQSLNVAQPSLAWSSTWAILNGSSTSNASPESSPSSTTSLSGGTIAGIVIGIVASVALLAGLFILLRKRQARKMQIHAAEIEASSTENDKGKFAGMMGNDSLEKITKPAVELEPVLHESTIELEQPTHHGLSELEDHPRP